MPKTQTAQHTPGPWIAEPEEASDHRGIAICAPHSGEILATITPADERKADERDWANARFIAAAPDLLEAARLAVIELGFVKNAEVESNALPDLRAAIAKAEGRE